MLKQQVKALLLSSRLGRPIYYRFAQPARRLYFQIRYMWSYRVKHQKSLDIELTTRCNLRCEYCGRRSSQEKGWRSLGDIDIKLLEKALDKLSTYRVANIALTGMGEPLLYPDLGEALRLFKTRFPNVSISFNTNGTVLTQRNAEMLVDQQLDNLTVSVNVLPREEYAKVEGLDALPIVLTNLETLLETKKKLHSTKPLVGIQIFREYAKNIDIVLDPLKNFKDLFRLNIIVKNNFFGYLKTEAKNPKRHPCSLEAGLTMDKDGNLYVCCAGLYYGPQSNLKMGNIFSDSLEEVDAKITRIQNIHKHEQWEKVPECQICNAWQYNPGLYVNIPLTKIWV